MRRQLNHLNVLREHPVLLAQIMFSLPFIHLSLRILGFKRTLNILQKLSTNTRIDDNHSVRQLPQAAEVGQLVNAVASRFRMSCLDRSVALWWLLQRQSAPAALYLAAPLEKQAQFEAHAWVECNGIVVNDAPQVRSRYAILTSYDNL